MAIEPAAGGPPQAGPETTSTNPPGMGPMASRRGSLNRRQVLGIAAAGGISVAALRLLGMAGVRIPGLGGQTADRMDWISPLGSESGRVAQLLRRATFGASPTDLERALGDGYAKTVERLIEVPPASPVPFPGGDIGSRAAPLNLAKLQKWWIDQMLTTPTPFAERMTLFWHGHFTSDFRKVGLQYPYLYWQNQTWREHSLGDLKGFLMAVTSDPAMLRYLDLGQSSAKSPNENYSRELMELFTMGAGTFTEQDVRNGAMALSGWREPRTQAMIDAEKKNPNVTPAQLKNLDRQVGDTSRTGIYDRARAYSGGPFAFLGKTDVFDTEKVIDQILLQKSTAPHIVTRVLAHFSVNSPSPAYVSRLSANFRASKYDIKTLCRDVFLSPEFVAPGSYRSLVKSPLEFIVHALRAIDGTQFSGLAVAGGSGMGQSLFDMPDVGGWPVNESWISSNTVLARINFISALVGGMKSVPAGNEAHVHHLDNVLSQATAQALNQATTDQQRWFIVLASPEFQLK